MILTEAVLRPFRTPWRLLKWLIIALLPPANLLLLGLNIHCMRTAEPGIPRISLPQLLKDTAIAALLIVVLAAPAFVMFLFQQTLLAEPTRLTGILLLALLIVILLAAYLLPAALVLYARMVIPYPARLLAIVARRDYALLWLIAAGLNAATTLATAYANQNLGAITAYLIGAFLFTLGQIWTGTVFSFTDTTAFETGGDNA